MEPVLIISNLVLIGLTGTYAWLTNKNAKQLRQESSYYRSVLEKQLQFSALPHLYWDLRPIDPPPEFTDQTNSVDKERRLLSEQSYEQSLSEPFSQQRSGQFGPSNGPSNLDIPSDSTITLQSSGQNGSLQSTSLALEVFNISNVPAYDIHVSLIGAYTEESLGIATFMRTHVQPRHRKYPLQSDKVGYYGVRNALRLSLLPTQQKIVLRLPFPIQPVDVYTLVQYRELSGQNYYQVCCFSAIDSSGAYRANILEPSNIQRMERLHLFDIEDFTLPDTGDGKDDLPYYLADFIDLWNHSISSRLMLKAPAAIAEDVPTQANYDF